jgi:TonB family protein
MNSKIIKIPVPSAYGAVEIKQWISRNTIKSMLITMMSLVLVYYIQGLVFAGDQPVDPTAPIGHKNTTVILDPDFFKPNDVGTDLPRPFVPDVIITGSVERIGDFIAVTDFEIADGLAEIADYNSMHKATSVGGAEIDGNGFGGVQSNPGNMNNIEIPAIETKELSHEEFNPVDIDPQCDLGEIRKLVEYPKLAQKLKIEGSVTISVLIGLDGRALKTKIISSDNRIFENAARKAVMNYVFVPAIQNNSPVACWLTLPINFRLR